MVVRLERAVHVSDKTLRKEDVTCHDGACRDSAEEKLRWLPRYRLRRCPGTGPEVQAMMVGGFRYYWLGDPA